MACCGLTSFTTAVCCKKRRLAGRLVGAYWWGTFGCSSSWCNRGCCASVRSLQTWWRGTFLVQSGFLPDHRLAESLAYPYVIHNTWCQRANNVFIYSYWLGPSNTIQFLTRNVVVKENILYWLLQPRFDSSHKRICLMVKRATALESFLGIHSLHHFSLFSLHSYGHIFQCLPSSGLLWFDKLYHCCLL